METVIAIGIFVVATGILTAAYVSQSRAYAKVRDRADQLSDGWIFERRFSTAARNAAGVVASRLMGGATYVSGSTTVVLSMPSIGSDGRALEGRFDHAAFRLDPPSGIVRVRVEPDPASARKAEDRVALRAVVAGGFRYDAFPPDAARTVSFGFVLRPPTAGGGSVSHIDGTYVLGNR